MAIPKNYTVPAGFVPIKTNYYKRKLLYPKVSVTITNRNKLCLSKGLHIKLGSPRQVSLMYNSSKKQLLICTMSLSNADFYCFNPYSPPHIHSKDLVELLSHVTNLDFSKAMSYCFQNIQISTNAGGYKEALVQL